jgi:4'-phosphopantetheinyl transferase EntD
MPFIGAIVDYLPGHSIRVERVLALEQDLHLAHHHFVPARLHKPLSACFPVLPMTFSLEAMAEVAACLAPGMGLTGIEQVGAGRWIALADSAELALVISAQLAAGDADSCRIAATIEVAGQAQPAISAVLVFGRTYHGTLVVEAPVAPVTALLDAAQIYARRQLFHGPALHCLQGAVVVAGQGASGSLLVRPPDTLFASTRTPQLLTDPALMDGVGQLIGVWAMQSQQRVTFPIGIDKLEYYAATPAPGSVVGIRIHTAVNGKFLRTDVEIDDGAGGVWLRIAGWKSWQFRWHARLIDFRRFPSRYLLSEPHALSGVAVCRVMDAALIADFDRTLLARHYLHQQEMALFEANAAHPARQLEWLLGRIAAKDAARAWARPSVSPNDGDGDDGGPDMLHPASMAIGHDALGQPFLAVWPPRTDAPCIGISHRAGRALAVAHGAPAGIDIEQVEPREAACVAAFSSAAERALLAGWSDAVQAATGPHLQRQESLTRLWCAKEALGKMLGSGVRPSPHDFVLDACEADGAILLMRHLPGGALARVTTLRDGPFICALGLAP